jgi:hypothetical protein
MIRRSLMAILVFSGLALPVDAPNAGPMRVSLVHSAAIDRACGLVRGYPIDLVWQAELNDRLPAMRAAWSRDGRPLLDTALRLAQKRLPGHRAVRLTLCDVPSSSLAGPVVNMRHALGSFTSTPVSLRYKAAVAGHELLHGALADVDLSNSRLLAVHGREAPRVRDHLHLFALMKAALLDRDRADLLAEIRRIDSALPGGAYRRAWELVDATPAAYLAYVDELRAAR